MTETYIIAFLERCSEKNIKLNPKKLQLRKQDVPYIGHVLTPDDLKPDPNKVKAIRQTSRRNRSYFMTHLNALGLMSQQTFSVFKTQISACFVFLSLSLSSVPSMIFGCNKVPTVGNSVFVRRLNNLWTGDDPILGEGVLRQSKIKWPRMNLVHLPLLWLATYWPSL